jgi:hypothetical protein
MSFVQVLLCGRPAAMTAGLDATLTLRLVFIAFLAPPLTCTLE